AATGTSCEPAPPALPGHASLQPRRLGHHRVAPGWLEGEFHSDLLDRGYGGELFLDVLDQHVSHAAARCRECHGHVDATRLVLIHMHAAFVHQSQVDDVDGNL